MNTWLVQAQCCGCCCWVPARACAWMWLSRPQRVVHPFLAILMTSLSVLDRHIPGCRDSATILVARGNGGRMRRCFIWLVAGVITRLLHKQQHTHLGRLLGCCFSIELFAIQWLVRMQMDRMCLPCVHCRMHTKHLRFQLALNESTYRASLPKHAPLWALHKPEVRYSWKIFHTPYSYWFHGDGLPPACQAESCWIWNNWLFLVNRRQLQMGL